MNDPFEVLRMAPTNDVEEIRHAYHALARKYHPDQFQDADAREDATRRMIALNEAYESALSLAASRSNMPYRDALSCSEAVILAQRLLSQDAPESALRHLLRADSRSALWYSVQGDALLAMEQYESAMQSYSEAIRMDPANNTYRRGRLNALAAQQRSQTLAGKLHRLIAHHKKRKKKA